jgi:hypothetical protein
MEIHKPKPIHNWREFLKEYAIIVLGVATALAAEQTVEWLHWQHEVSIARKALRDEIATIDQGFMRRIAIRACRERQEREAKAILDGLGTRGAAHSFTAFHHSAGAQVPDTEWQAERAAQVLTHFPRDELALMSAFYAALPHIDTWTNDEGAEWAALSVLQTAPANVAPSDITRLRGALDHAHRLNYLLVAGSYRMLKLSDQIGVVRPPAEPGYVGDFCKKSDSQVEAETLQALMKP